MATKNISITEEAYERLAGLKKDNESFSEIIITITHGRKLGDFFGILSNSSADKIEKNIAELRAKHRKRNIQRKKGLAEEILHGVC